MSHDARTSPILYKRYLDALWDWLLEGMVQDRDPLAGRLNELKRQLSMREDVLKAMGLKPHPQLLARMRELVEAFYTANSGSADFADPLAFKSCVDYLEAQGKALVALGVGVIIKHSSNSTVVHPRLTLSLFSYNHYPSEIASPQ